MKQGASATIDEGRRLWPNLAASLFGMVLGLGGLANGWRTAARVWAWPATPGQALALLAIGVWATLAVLHIGRWLRRPDAALAELRHPVASSFVALGPIATAVASIALQPFWPPVAFWMMIVGVAGQMAFAVAATRALALGTRQTADTTPALYVPTVGGFLVSAMAAAAFGYHDAAALLFGAGLLSWLTLESVALTRLITAPPIPLPLRATMGLYFTPPSVACVAYLAITDGPPDLFAQGLFGYGVFHAAVGLSLIPWLLKQPFATSYWAYTFGLSALPLAALRLVERGQGGPVVFLALPLLIGSTAAIATIFAGTFLLLARHWRTKPAKV